MLSRCLARACSLRRSSCFGCGQLMLKLGDFDFGYVEIGLKPENFAVGALEVPRSLGGSAITAAACEIVTHELPKLWMLAVPPPERRPFSPHCAKQWHRALRFAQGRLGAGLTLRHVLAALAGAIPARCLSARVRNGAHVKNFKIMTV